MALEPMRPAFLGLEHLRHKSLGTRSPEAQMAAAIDPRIHIHSWVGEQPGFLQNFSHFTLKTLVKISVVRFPLRNSHISSSWWSGAIRYRFTQLYTSGGKLP